jgi:hypothetical protein
MLVFGLKLLFLNEIVNNISILSEIRRFSADNSPYCGVPCSKAAKLVTLTPTLTLL